MFQRSIIAIVALIAVAATNAQAITFNLTGTQSRQSSFTVIGSDGLTSVVVTGFNTQGQQLVDRDSDGMGVFSGGNDSDEVDGDGRDETLAFDFGSVLVQLVSATFREVGSNDDFELIVGGSVIGSVDIPNSGTYTFAGTYIDTEFGFTVENDNDDYKISSINVNPTAVPEPATLVLLGSSLLGLGARRRFRA